VEVLDDLYEKLNIGALVEAKFKERLEMKIRSESDIDELYLRSLKQLCSR
jgi:hypothetical protein